MQSVLVVDDEKHTRDGLAAVLADNYDVFAASSADEAIKMLDAEIFDAVITDLRMAGKSGLSVIDKAVSLPYKPVCIMLTAYGNVEMAVEAMKRGASDFLSKPVDVEKLENILRQSLSKREKQRAEDDPDQGEKMDRAPHVLFRRLEGPQRNTGEKRKRGEKGPHLIPSVVTFADSKVAMRVMIRDAASSRCMASAAPEPSPRRMERSSSGFLSSSFAITT